MNIGDDIIEFQVAINSISGVKHESSGGRWLRFSGAENY